MKKRTNMDQLFRKKKHVANQQKTKSPSWLSLKAKRVIIAICSSLLIGTIFGLVTLQMSKQADHHNAEILHSTTLDEDGTSSGTIDSFNVYVIQGGVFHEEENATQWKMKFENLQFKAFTWKRADEYYLFAGIASNMESAKELADKMDKQGLDVYIKELTIDEKTIKGTEADYVWLQSFIDQWQASLNSVHEGTGLLADDWITLTEKTSGLSDQIQGFNDTIIQHVKEISNDEEQHVLLQLLYNYEQVTR